MYAWVQSGSAIGSGASGLVDLEGATLSIRDHGFTVGDGVFEALKVVDGQPFAMTRHLRRLRESATALLLDVPAEDVLRAAVAAVLDANLDALGHLARVRLTLTGGIGPAGTERGTDGPTLVVVAGVARAWAASSRIATVPWARNDLGALAGIKSTSYADNVIALATAKATGADEAVMPNTRGELCEGTGTNVFVVVDGVIHTPPLSSGCLGGITRELVLEWLDVRESAQPISILQSAGEIFVTSSTRDIQPVSWVDGRELVAPGPVTRAAMQVFAERAAEGLDP
jgi:branched-chain amino acid aminotransferase